MRWLRFAGVLCLAAVLQAGLLAHLSIKPDLLLILLVFFAVYSRTSDAIITSFATGFAADIIGFTMGPQIISFGLFGTALAHLHRVVNIRKISYQVPAIFVTGFLAGCLANLLTLFKGEQAPANIYSVLFATSLFSALIGPILFLPTAWWMRVKTRRFRRR